MIVTISIEREIEEGKQIGSKRYMNFRNDGLIECGGRFTGLPDKLELSAKNFMVAFEQGVKGSLKTPLTDEQFKKAKEKEIKEFEKKVEEVSEMLMNKIPEIPEEQTEPDPEDEPVYDDSAERAEQFKQIQKLYPKADKETKVKIKEFMTKHSVIKFSAELDLSFLEGVVALLS
jgi:hypothetical protein